MVYSLAGKGSSLNHGVDAILIPITALLFVAWTTVLLRMWVRGRMLKSTGLDDWAMLLALFVFTVYSSFTYKLSSILKSPDYGDADTLRQSLTFVFATFVTYAAETVILKISLSIFFLRVVTFRVYKVIIYITLMTYTSFGTAYFFFVLFQCGNPLRYYEENQEKHCVPFTIMGPMTYTQSILGATTDFVLAAIPVFLLWNVQMSRRTKISVGGCLVLATLGSISSVIRIAYIGALGDKDKTILTLAELGFWSILEMGLGIIAGSLATLKPLFQRWSSQVRKITSRNGRREGDEPSYSGFPGGGRRSIGLSYIKLGSEGTDHQSSAIERGQQWQQQHGARGDHKSPPSTVTTSCSDVATPRQAVTKAPHLDRSIIQVETTISMDSVIVENYVGLAK